MNRQIFLILFIISMLVLSGCTIGKTTSGKLTEDISDYKTLCVGDTADTCFEAVAMYNQDQTICDLIAEDDVKQICKKKIEQGQLVNREFTVNDGCSSDTRPFFESCEQLCTKKGLEFKKDNRQSIDDPLPLVSVGGFIDLHCQEDQKSTTFMACYCY